MSEQLSELEPLMRQVFESELTNAFFKTCHPIEGSEMFKRNETGQYFYPDTNALWTGFMGGFVAGMKIFAPEMCGTETESAAPNKGEKTDAE